ncbi:uncharacterized protein THITE_2024021, partial [Thermothielavioides terrestris NRRL 8126]
DAVSDDASGEALFVDQDQIKVEDESQHEGDDELSQEHDSETDDGGESESEESEGGEDGSDGRSRTRSDAGRDVESDGRRNPPDDARSDDDDCRMVESHDIPAETMAKFANYQPRPRDIPDIICTGSVRIKAEPQDDDIVSLVSESHEKEADPDFVVSEDAILSDGERPRKRRRPAPSRRGRQKKGPAGTERPGLGNRGENISSLGDGDWHEPPEDELVRLYIRLDELNDLKAQGSLTFADKVALAKTSARIAAIERMAEQQGPGLDLAGAGASEPTQLQPGVAKANKPRRQPARNAKEYWEREYAEKGSGLRNVLDTPHNRKRPVGQAQKRGATKQDKARESKLMRMLKDTNPIMARAAQGAVAMPGPIQATNRVDQLKAMKDFLFKISSNPNPRSRPVDLKILNDAARSFGFRQARAVNGQWKLPGMKTLLHNHQLVGVSWMLRQEFSPHGPYGGILGDQMGLGKTVQMLAAMSANRPSEEDVRAGRHQTLIVAPAIAIDQWKREILTHCEESFISKIHHFKQSQKLEEWMWKSADVILASYQEVARAYPSEKELRCLAGRKLDGEEWAKEFDALLGELFGTEFFRVVLDEGHAIRNPNTRTAQACINLTSKYRWILSGTPLHNSAGVAHKKMSTYLAYLTRLRQAVAHPLLLEGVLKDNFTLEDFTYLRKQLAAIGGKTPMHRQVQHWVNMEYEGRTEADGLGPTFGKSRFGFEFDMNEELAELEAGTTIQDVLCRACYEPPVDPQITECGHAFCKECITEALKVRPACPTCRAAIYGAVDLQEPECASGEALSDREAADGKSARKTRKKRKKERQVGDDERWVQPKMKDRSKWIEQYDKSFPNKGLVASAKTIAVKNQILIWQREAPDDKIIVFVNWAKLACILGRMLYEEGIPFLYYFGDLSTDDKSGAIADFQYKPDIKVLISSLRCGGFALNLAFANRVISVDQWWNTAMETQAFGRVHRIGQRKETHFVKVVVKDSIDQALLSMQESKDREIARALQEDPGHKTALTMEEIARLFGIGEDKEDGEEEEGEEEGAQ